MTFLTPWIVALLSIVEGMKIKLVWKSRTVEMTSLAFRKCVQKGDRITSLYGSGDSLNRYCVSIGSFVTAVIHLPNSSMNSVACMSHVPPVSIATGTKMFVSVRC